MMKGPLMRSHVEEFDKGVMSSMEQPDEDSDDEDFYGGA